MALIEVRGLTKLYAMGDSVVRALDGVDLTIERGEFVAITGASGSGKSTMMHVLGCLDRPTGGSYRLESRDVSNLSDRELAAVRNKLIGFVFQTFNLINRTTAAENVGVPLFYARRTNTAEPAMRALERVGLAQRATHQPNELSGGERQRVAIARAIVNDPVLVLADEPTGNLDSRTGEQIMQIFHALNEQGVTIVLVTHEPDIAEQTRRIVHMRDGRIVSDRRTADILAEQGRTAYVRPPTTSGPPAAEVEQAAAPQPTAPLNPILVPGANGAFGCGLTAAGLWALAIVAQLILKAVYKIQPTGATPQQQMPPMPVIIGGLTSCGAMLAGLVLAILAVVFGLKARRKMRTEPGNWQGRKRVLTGLILGLIAIVVSLAITVIGVIQAVQQVRQSAA